ncbi:DUF397 domain-containing protein [Streptomyces sp. B3I8]|uniref:DUF397 domain-containing protein n=1 Tax=Streptomyces sp. B3I8 TaxID=3042303 RepID=UPI00277E99A8|nr:DUF397 domain-containing protein [Streptomyces sp. B3I8]MDQ0787201.1 hypothetical protein [Streptomyces sp. B3I8]
MPGPSPAPHELAWFKSSYSGGNATECVECAHVDDSMHIRDSKLGDELVIGVRQRAWANFLASISGSKLARVGDL